MVFLFVLFVIFIILNFTAVFQRPTRKNILDLKYTCTEDLWFKKEGNKKLLVCLHGMFSTPYTFEDLAHDLVEKGWDVYAMTLPASANTREDLQSIGSWSWEESMIVVRDKISKLSGYEEYSLIGHSQGGSFAMEVITENIKDFSSLIVVAAPINLYGSHMTFTGNTAIFLSGLMSFFYPKGFIFKIKNPELFCRKQAEIDELGIQYPHTIFTFKRGVRALRKNLYKIKTPVLLAYCEGDRLVNESNMWKISKKISSKYVESVLCRVSYDDDPVGLKCFSFAVY